MDLRRKGCLILLLVSVLEVAVKGNNNVVFNVKHRYGGRGGSILNELRAHDSHRHGRMLAAVDFPLGGNGQPTDAALVPPFLSLILLVSSHSCVVLELCISGNYVFLCTNDELG
ncbi:hypothetical protein BC332_34728 [Capsicum chinense]|nr:hypothetical protein BC332_34728 [Capsicum chinense]